MKREISAGGVIFHKFSRTDAKHHIITSPQASNSLSNLKILLIKDSYGRWSLPKGHVGDTIAGETNEQASLRECSEETGIPPADLSIIEKLGEVKYFYQLKGEKIFKVVHFFLVESLTEQLKPNWEVQAAEWFEPTAALEKSEYENSKSIVKKAIEKIETLI